MKMRMVLCVAVVMVTALLLGCTGAEARQAWMDRLGQLEAAQASVNDRVSDLAVLASDLASELEAMPADAPGRDALTEYIAQVEKARLEVEAYGARIADAVAEVKTTVAALDTESPLAVNATGAGSALTSAAPLLPPPWNGIAAIGGTLLGAFGAALAKRSKAQLQDVVFAIDTAKRGDEQVAKSIDNVGSVIRAAMGKSTAEKVDNLRK